MELRGKEARQGEARRHGNKVTVAGRKGNWEQIDRKVWQQENRNHKAGGDGGALERWEVSMSGRQECKGGKEAGRKCVTEVLSREAGETWGQKSKNRDS